MNTLEKHKTIWRVALFSVLVNGVAFLSPLLGGSPSKPGLGFILWGVAPMLISLVMRVVTRDWADLGHRPTFKQNLQWYGMSFFAVPILMLLTLGVDVLTSLAIVSGFSLGEFLKTVLIALPIFFIFAIFEEVGWRGYLPPNWMRSASIGLWPLPWSALSGRPGICLISLN